MNRKYLFILALSSIMANAQYDGFNYSGAINANGWVSNTKEKGEIIVNPQGLTYPDTNTLGGKISLSTNGKENANLAFTQPSTTSVYASFLLKITDVSLVRANNDLFSQNVPYFVYFSPDSGEKIGTSTVSRLGIRKGTQDGTFNIGVINANGKDMTPNDVFGSQPTDYKVGETYFVVLKYDMSGEKGKTSFWVNSISDTEPAPIHSSTFGTSKKQTQISSLVLRQTKNFMPTVELDEFRLGHSWADILPESSLSIAEAQQNKALISNTLVKDNFRVLANANIEIYTTSGALVKRGSYRANQEVSAGDLNTGVYILKISTEKGTSVVKIIKQ